MGMPAFYITALTALILAYGDVQDWSAFAILGIALAAGAAIAFTAKKHSYWATVSVVAVLIASDAIGRGMNDVPSSLHSSIGLSDLGYSTFLLASVGWLGGWLMRGRESSEDATMMARQLEPEVMPVSRNPFAAPDRRRRSA
jgi:heme A synthase